MQLTFMSLAHAAHVAAGDPTGKTGRLASWQFPFVVPGNGRVYLFWNQNVGVIDARAVPTAAQKIGYRNPIPFNMPESAQHVPEGTTISAMFKAGELDLLFF